MLAALLPDMYQEAGRLFTQGKKRTKAGIHGSSESFRSRWTVEALLHRLSGGSTQAVKAHLPSFKDAISDVATVLVDVVAVSSLCVKDLS